MAILTIVEYSNDNVTIVENEFSVTIADFDTSIGSQEVTKYLRGSFGNPQGWYTLRPQIAIFKPSADIHITFIGVYGNDSTPTAELAGDLKYADDQFDGVFANPVVIDVIDTTSGVKEISLGFDNAAVPAGKWVYLQMDSSPHADWESITFDIRYTYD